MSPWDSKIFVQIAIARQAFLVFYDQEIDTHLIEEFREIEQVKYIWRILFPSNAFLWKKFFLKFWKLWNNSAVYLTSWTEYTVIKNFLQFLDHRVMRLPGLSSLGFGLKISRLKLPIKRLKLVNLQHSITKFEESISRKIHCVFFFNTNQHSKRR